MLRRIGRLSFDVAVFSSSGIAQGVTKTFVFSLPLNQKATHERVRLTESEVSECYYVNSRLIVNADALRGKKLLIIRTNAPSTELLIVGATTG